MVPPSWLSYAACAPRTHSRSSSRSISRESLSFCPLEETWWSPGTGGAGAGGVARTPARLWDWPAFTSCGFAGALQREAGLDKRTGYQRVAADTGCVWEVTFTTAPAGGAENGPGDSCGALGKHSNGFLRWQWLRFTDHLSPLRVLRNWNNFKTSAWFS